MLKSIIVLFLLVVTAGAMAETIGTKTVINEDLQQKFLAAIDNKDLEQVKKLLSEGASPDVKIQGDQLLLSQLLNYDGYSQERDDITSYLIKYGAKIDYAFDDGTTFLHSAAELDLNLSTKALLDRGIDRTKKSNDGRSALFYAHSMAMFQLLLDYNVGDIGEVDNQGDSLVHVHIQTHGKQDLIDYLLTKIDVNIKNSAGETALVQAASNSIFGLEYVKKLIQSGADSDDSDEQGFQSIHYGARQDPKMFFWLAERGANIHALTDANKYSTLYLAANNNEIDIVKYLLDKEIDINHTSLEGMTALNVALENGNEPIAQLLRDNGGIATSQEDIEQIAKELEKQKAEEAENKLSSNDRLKISIRKNDFPEIEKYYVEVLNDPALTIDDYEVAVSIIRWSDEKTFAFAIENGLDILAKDDDGFSLLHDAVFFNNISIAQLLIDNGLDVNTESPEGSSVYEMTKNSSVEMVELLLKANVQIDKSKDLNMAEEALYQQKPEMVAYFLEQGHSFPADILKNEEYLLEVVRTQDVETLQYLLDKGLDIESRVSIYGDMLTLLHASIIIDSELMALFILKAGGDPNARDSSGKPIFSTLIEHDNQAIIVAFYDNGGNVNDVSGEGFNKKTPLLQAVKSGHTKTAELLIEKGADLKEVNYMEKDSALHLAARIGDLVLIKSIIDNGGNVHQLNEARHAALDIAIKFGHKDAERYLREMELQLPERMR